MEGFEKIRPSWEKITAKKVKPTRKEKPKITFTSALGENNISTDRIGFNKDALKILGITGTSKCELFVQKKTKRLAISLLKECDTDDSFTISVSNDNASIRRKSMFRLLAIPEDVIKMLQKEAFHSELKKEESFFIADLPIKTEIESSHYGITIAPEILHTDKKSARARTTDMPQESDLHKILEDM